VGAGRVSAKDVFREKNGSSGTKEKWDFWYKISPIPVMTVTLKINNQTPGPIEPVSIHKTKKHTHRHGFIPHTTLTSHAVPYGMEFGSVDLTTNQQTHGEARSTGSKKG
jgi:hypothetical protein